LVRATVSSHPVVPLALAGEGNFPLVFVALGLCFSEDHSTSAAQGRPIEADRVGPLGGQVQHALLPFGKALLVTPVGVEQCGGRVELKAIPTHSCLSIVWGN